MPTHSPALSPTEIATLISVDTILSTISFKTLTPDPQHCPVPAQRPHRRP